MDNDVFVPIEAPGSTLLTAEEAFGSKYGKVAASALDSKQTLSAIMICFITYISVSGGPYGLEDAVGVGYGFITMVGLLCAALFWGTPIALISSELSVLLPYDGGYIIWVHEAMGSFWSTQKAWLSIVNMGADLALYPCLITDYAARAFVGENGEEVFSFWMRVVIRLAVVTFCTGLNLLGVQAVGIASIIMSVIITVPFVVFCAIGAPQLDISRLVDMPPNLLEVDWGLFLAVIAWNMSGFDSVSILASRVPNPAKQIPRGIIGGLIMSAISYLVPIAIGISIAPDLNAWVVGYWADVGGMVGGEYLKWGIICGAIVAAVSILNAYLLTTAQLISATGESYFLDIPLLTQENRHRVPVAALLITAVMTSLGAFLPFRILVQVDQICYAFGTIIELFAFLILRFKYPHVERRYRIPGGMGVAFVVTLLPVTICLGAIGFQLMDKLTAIISGITVILGLFIYIVGSFFFKRRAKQRALVLTCEDSPLCSSDQSHTSFDGSDFVAEEFTGSTVEPIYSRVRRDSEKLRYMSSTYDSFHDDDGGGGYMPNTKFETICEFDELDDSSTPTGSFDSLSDNSESGNSFSSSD